MPGIRPLLALLGLASLVVACVPVTVNINFPQEKIEGAATRIEDMVRSPENPPPPPAPESAPKKPQSHLADRLLAALAPRAAEAQVPEIRVQTPELMRAIRSRQARNPQIDQWKAKGCLGETNQGLIEARPGQGCGGEGSLIGAENTDRNFIYATLMQQNNMPASDAPRVRAAFAQANRDLAKPGEWVQQPNGQWTKK
jgi:uncharacterized protein YdbL (DUF1318 family)